MTKKETTRYISNSATIWWNKLDPETKIDIYNFMEKYTEKKLKPIVEIKESKVKKHNEEIREVIDVYWKFYQAIFGFKPTANFPKVRKLLNILFENPDINLKIVSACIPVYLLLDDDYLKRANYPLEWFSYRINECKKVIYKEFPNLSEEKGCQKYLSHYLEKYNIKSGNGKGGDKQPNSG